MYGRVLQTNGSQRASALALGLGLGSALALGLGVGASHSRKHSSCGRFLSTWRGAIDAHPTPTPKHTPALNPIPNLSTWRGTVDAHTPPPQLDASREVVDVDDEHHLEEHEYAESGTDPRGVLAQEGHDVNDEIEVALGAEQAEVGLALGDRIDEVEHLAE